MQKLKVAVIREELVALTGDYKEAVILNQFIYWSERVKDVDKFILEEKERALNEGIEINVALQNGWIYKKAEELAEEVMMNIAPNTMRRYIKKLVDKGYIMERRNPIYKWDRTLQYRVELLAIQDALKEIGYTLQGYKVELRESKAAKQRNELAKQMNRMINQTDGNGAAIPETTIKDYNKEATFRTKPLNAPAQQVEAVEVKDLFKQVGDILSGRADVAGGGGPAFSLEA